MKTHSKKTNSRRILSLVLVTLVVMASFVSLLSSSASAQTNFTRSGSAGAQFLKIGVGARYLALGEASVAASGDAFSLYWNPAALTEIDGQQLAFTHVNWILDVSLNYAAYAKRIEDFGVLAVGVTALTVPEQEITTVEEPNGVGRNYSASSYAIQIGFARELTHRFSFGAGVKYIYESIHLENATGFAFDFGTMLHTGLRSLRLGMNISNLGGEMRFDGPDLGIQYLDNTGDGSKIPVDSRIAVESYDLPLTFRVGAAYDFDLSFDSRFTILSEMKHPNDNDQQLSFGFEYSNREKFFLRSGYKFNYAEEGLTLGAGLIAPFGNDNGLVIDYAWSDFGRLNSVHRFSAVIDF
ncbi:MAG: PorV/PorQ family protein [candidate division Zixibacteria bacterium]|nr:PorV/PorQ family protein [candidate division Zixibacteria bacterium]